MTSPTPQNPQPAPPHRKKGSGLLILGLLAVLAVAAGGIIIRVHEGSALDRTTREEAIPSVVVIKAPRGPGAEDIVLPGNVQARHEAPIYARASGYLKEWRTDIGATVKAGDLIAVIETPEVDAQLRQAEADLATAQANNRLAQSTAKRWANLLKTNSVSKQDADDKQGAAAAGAAAVASAQANLDRLHKLESFERITAPFDGIITARNTDTGALINAGSSGNGPELFHIVDTGKLRVYVQVPEIYVPAIKPDLTAELRFTEHPGETFPAVLARTADAFDPVTRTLLIELEVDNREGTLLPGGYTEVHLKIPAPTETVHLPVNTLLFRADGMEVATVDANSRALLKPISIGRDYGKEVEVKFGIAPDELIIVNPPDSLVTGQPVRIAGPQNNKQENKNGGEKPANGESKP
jgi:RND family efflux transporter MFP subunit